MTGCHDRGRADRTTDADLLGQLPAGFLSSEELGGATPVRDGMSAAVVFRIVAPVQTLYLKIADRHAAAALREEIVRTGWLGAQGIRVPRLLRTVDTDDVVAMLTAELPGRPIEDCGRPIDELIEIIARGLKALHALPAAGCPFDESVETRLARAQAMIARGDVEPAHFAWRNRQLTPQQIFDRLAARVPVCVDPVIVHGDASFGNLRIADGGTLGFLDCGHAGRGDRYVDLERIAGEIEEHVGASWIEVFCRAYGIATWDRERASFFTDLYELF